MKTKLIPCLLAAVMLFSVPTYAQGEPVVNDVVRTTFQTAAAGEDETSHVLADSVMVYISNPASLESKIGAWTGKGYQVDVMMAVNRDMNDYVPGNFDGQNHEDEIQLDKDGNRFTHPTDVHVPYMVPTENWNKYVYELSRRSIEAGAKRIVFEEPDVFLKSGYSEAFKREWQTYYGQPWVAPDSSRDAEYKAQKLKVYLSYRTFKEVSEKIKTHSPGTEVLIAAHTGISYLMYGITTSNYDYYNIPTIDGYIGQVWSDTALVPVPYAGKSERRMFESAYIDYSSFANLKLGNDGKQLYALADPKADSGSYGWQEYEDFYKTTIAAQLMQPQFKQFEVVPWAERGFAQAPGSYKTVQTNVFRALQDMYDKPASVEAGTSGIGVLYSDTISQMASSGSVNSFYGPMVPLVAKGLPIQVIPVENLTKTGALSDTKVLFASYDVWKAVDGNGSPQTGIKVNEAIRDWVNGGGVLVYTGGSGASDSLSEWWQDQNMPSPKQDLWNKLGLAVTKEKTSTGTADVELQAASAANGAFGGRGSVVIPRHFTVTSADLGAGAVPLYTAGGKAAAYEQPVGSGKVIVVGVTPAYFAASQTASQLIRDIAKYAVEQAGETYTETNVMKAVRGPYTAIQTLEQPAQIQLQGSYIDLFDDRLPVVGGMTEMMAESNMLVLDISGKAAVKPEILFASGSLTDVGEMPDTTEYTLSGTPNSRASTRIGAPAGVYPQAVGGTDKNGSPVTVSWEWENSSKTLLIRHDHRKDGVKISVQWSDEPLADSIPVDFMDKIVKTNQDNLDAAYVVKNTGGAIADFRFMDHDAELVYGFDLNQNAKARVSLDVANNYIISVSPDNVNWTELYRAPDERGRAIKTIDLSAYAAEGGKVYVKMENADKTTGNGPVIYGFILSHEQRIAPFTVRSNRSLELGPGQTGSLQLAITNRDPEPRNVDMTLSLNAEAQQLSFKTGTEGETPYLFANSGSELTGDGSRYADSDHYFVYRLPVTQDMIEPSVKLTLANRFEVSISADGENWIVADVEGQPVEGQSNKAERSYPLEPYVNDSGYVYVKIGNSQKTGGWGGMLQKLVLTAQSEGELSAAFPDNNIALLPHQTRLIRVEVTADAGIQTAQPAQMIRFSSGEAVTEFMMPVKISFTKPEYKAAWASTPVTINGQEGGNEWSDAQIIEISGSAPEILRYGMIWGDSSSLKAKYRMKWDAQNLYVLEEREDSAFAFTETGATMYASTASMLFLDIDHNKNGATYGSGDYALFFTPSGPDSQPHVFMRRGRDSGKEEEALTSAVIQSSVDQEAHKYTVEMAIPWSALQTIPFVPANGTKVGMTVAATRNAGPGVWGQVMWVGDGDDQAKWADMKFTGKPDGGDGGSGGGGGTVGPGGSGVPEGNGSTGNADAGADGSSSVLKMSLEEIRSKLGKSSLVLTMKEAGGTVELPLQAGSILENQDVQLNAGRFSASFPAALLRALTSQHESAAEGTVALLFNRISDELTAETMKQAVVPKHVQLKLRSPLFEVGAQVTTGDRTSSAEHFAEPVKLAFEQISTDKVGPVYLYRILPDGKLTYIPAHKENGKYTAEIIEPGMYALLEYDIRYEDVPSGHWAYEVLRDLSARQIVEGMPSGRFEPKADVTRAEFAAMLVRVFRLEAGTNAGFADVQEDSWYAGPVAAAFKAGIITGITTEEFGPNQVITREQMAVMLVRALLHNTPDGMAGDGHAVFRDMKKVSGWASESVNEAIRLQLIQGRADGSIAPLDSATRAESAQLIYNGLNRMMGG
ncbi:S-layer homology domain-containing protein [Paenibacillus mendelii]|uniref:S-layer homology domain-containing protein n=1 Tax=Paenibacillus mendelii TaxID=206163 RepID=A0ABV6J300_9BACL|nr:S-layer homology domain-containing protein [Paenibacillus mendelii]MCQ6559364.1 S-layer homology domain-containing protein [Paenibacillus mendelii]